MQAKRAGTLPEKEIHFCSFNGCEREYKGRGYCTVHYHEAKVAGNLPHLGACSEEGCSKSRYEKGLCGDHYQQARFTGDARFFKICRVETCLRVAKSQGLCGKHYKRSVKHGDPLYEPEKLDNCIADDCERALGAGSARGLCSKRYQQQWTAENPDKIAAYKAEGKTKGWARKSHLMRTYGITVEQYDKMLQDQGGCCAICGSDSPGQRYPSFHVDHDHATGELRGLLCSFCNLGLGSMKDDPEFLDLAAAYIRHYRKKQGHQNDPIKDQSPVVRNG